MPIISIAEAQEIIRAIKLKYNYDFSNYTLTSFRYSLDQTISTHFLRFPKALITRLLEDETFFDLFLYDVSVQSSEMFRDAGMWKFLYEEVLGEFPTSRKIHAWLPDIGNGSDLFSFLVLLNKAKRSHQFRTTASSLSEKSIHMVYTGILTMNNKVLDNENYENVFSDHKFRSFFTLKNGELMIDKGLLTSVDFVVTDLNLNPAPAKADIILFRNKLLNYTTEFQNHLLDGFVETLESGGYLITGYKEEIGDYLLSTGKMEVFNNDEKIYRKKTD